MSLLEKMSWRYATKKFDPAKKIPADKLKQVLDTVRLAPSSLGLQHYRIVVIEDADVRARLREAGFGQSQFTDASQVILFAAETNLNEEYVNRYADEIIRVRNVTPESIAGYRDTMLGAVKRFTEEEKLVWAHKQAYIALGVLVAATADLDIDVCPMEGFDKDKFDEILSLKEKGLTSSVVATIGYRAADDAHGTYAKVRKPDSHLFIHI